MDVKTKSRSTRPGGLPGSQPGARPGVGAYERAPDGRAFAHGARPGPARTGDMGSSTCGLTTRRRNMKGPVQCGSGGRPRREPWRSNPRTRKLVIGTWNVTSLAGKEQELVAEVEKYRLDIVGLTSTHSIGSGTQVLERGWTVSFAGVAPGEKRRAGVGFLLAPRLSACVLGFTPRDEWVASLRLRVGERVLTAVCAYAPNIRCPSSFDRVPRAVGDIDSEGSGSRQAEEGGLQGVAGLWVSEAADRYRIAKRGAAVAVAEVKSRAWEEFGLSWLTRLCNIAWSSGVFPVAWQTGVVVPIFKKGNLRGCSNYRGITLLSLPGKVYSKV
ncbi:uncharacterized protein [Nothobranchius furzeri]|uniref:uncharacterized protein n=1 Tax=Nothobranchius furzeri TaxID=105023 RepID=UPI003904A27F